MPKIYKSVSELIGRTPILELINIKKNHATGANIYAKLECFNPAGSAKDRVALSIIDDAEKKGMINKDTIIIEPTSGNTGIGISSVAASRGYRVIIVMPDTSAVLSGEKAGSHGLQGIGAGFVPEILNTKIYDEIIKVSKEDAYSCAREMGTSEGVLVGISSGAALFAALEIAKREEYKGKNIVVLLPDSGERYLSTDLYK